MTESPKYRGLVNQGSTCYLNSLLQTLFMTPQFRKNVYNYIFRHDQRKISAIDSIPYQLQKLFVQLQLNQKYVYTKGLLRSFQWDRTHSFQQHDVQQFCRILFQALAQSSKGNNWIDKLYSGVFQSYLSCGTHPRSTQQPFMDISLPIRSQFNNTFFISIQQCLKQYLRPQTLDDKVQCQKCGKKVIVQKGLKLHILPQILTLQINRFELNYTTMQRQKLNNFIYFPQILQIYRFFEQYNKIQLKGLPHDLFNKINIIQQNLSSQSLPSRSNTQKSSTQSSSIPIQRSYVNFMNQLKHQSICQHAVRKKSSEKYKFSSFEQQNKNNLFQLILPQQQKQKNIQILQQLKANHQIFSLPANKKYNIQSKSKQDQKKLIKPINNQPTIKTQTKNTSIEDDMLFGTFMDGFDRTGNHPQLNNFSNVQVTNQSSKFKDKTRPLQTQIIFDHQQQHFDPNKQYPDNTYILFSVLVHSGSAYGGHYYAYIFDGINWYCFNDNNVRQVARQQIRKYGNPQENSSHKANAYLLFYRQSKTFKNIQHPIQIPPSVLQKIRNQKIVVPIPSTQQKTLQEQAKPSSNLTQSKVIIKIKYKNNELHTIKISNRHQQSIKQLKNLIKQQLKIQQSDNNWRLRRYNKNQDTMNQIYDIQLDNKTLQQVGLRQISYLAIQIKKNQQSFQQYDPKNIIIKINLWREALTLLTQSFLKPIKISINQQKTFGEFYNKVKELTNIQKPIIIKRNFTQKNSYQIYNLQDNQNKTLISLRFFNGINLYVQQQTTNKLKWQKQFQDQKYKCKITFNNPKQINYKQLQLYFDTRKTLGQLKQKLSSILQLNINQFRIKKSQHSVSQMTQFKKKLTDLRFINSQFLYIQQGRSSKGTIILRKGLVNLVDDQINFTLGQQFQIQISSNTKILQLKQKISEKYSIPPDNIRIRQFKSSHFGQIFPNSQPIAKHKQKSLIWQQTQTQDPKALQLYIRHFNHLTLQLGPLLSIFIHFIANYQQLSLILQQQLSIQSNKILVYKPIANFIDQSLLFDCQWIQIKYIQKSIRESPLYISVDGDVLIIKQADQPYLPKYVSNQSTNIPTLVFNKQIQKNQHKRQQGLKITVVKEKQDSQIGVQQQITTDLQTTQTSHNENLNKSTSQNQQPNKQI